MNANEIKSPMTGVSGMEKYWDIVAGLRNAQYVLNRVVVENRSKKLQDMAEKSIDSINDAVKLYAEIDIAVDAANKRIEELITKLNIVENDYIEMEKRSLKRIAELEAKLQPCPKCGTEMGPQTYPRDGTWWCPNIKCSHSVRTRTPTTINESQLDIVLKNIIFQAEQSRAGDFRHDSWDLDAHVEITLTISDLRHTDRLIKKPAEPQPEADDVRTYHAKGNTDWTPLCGSDERSIAHTHATVNCPSCLAKLKQSEVQPVEKEV
jgi:rubrerythrin